MLENRQMYVEELERNVLLCVSTYVNMYGVMPSTRQMCYQVGCENEQLVEEFIGHFQIAKLKATA